MSASAPFSYDEMPYISLPFMQTHPGRLATMAKLFGLHAPAVESCRVLELGCASGGNLISMAIALPGARFLGIDLSARQIEQGQQIIAGLGLANIELRHADIAAVDAAYGAFDYIISHGIYSWVPAPIREKLLAIGRDHLVSNGVAYVSYNTLPGWGIRGILRDVMLYHSRAAQGAAERIRQARDALDFMSRCLPEDTAYGTVLRQDLEGLATVSDAYLSHDHLEVDNEPFYFYQLAAAAQQHGLQYLAEAEFSAMAPKISPQAKDWLRRIAPDLIAREQYLDFLHHRSFRQTLLVHEDIALNRNLDAQSVQEFAIASPVQPVSGRPTLTQGVSESFRAPNGASIDTGSAISKAALLVLTQEWPGALPFPRLVAAARGRLQQVAGALADPATLERDTRTLGIEMLQCYAAGVAQLRVWSPRLCLKPGERPVASPLARLQAAHGNEVTNLLQQGVTLSGIGPALLPLLDGSSDRDALVAALAGMVKDGALQLQRQGSVMPSGRALEETLRASVNETLAGMAKAALLLEQ